MVDDASTSTYVGTMTGTTTALVSFTSSWILPDTVPAETVTAIMRSDLSLPTDIFALTTPDASDTVFTATKLPDVVEKDAFTPSKATFAEFLITADISTSAPEVDKTAEDGKTSTELGTLLVLISPTVSSVLPDTVPAVTVTVISRNVLLLPIESFAVTTPDVSDTVVTGTKFPEVVENETLTPDKATLDAFFTTAEICISAPDNGTTFEDDKTSIIAGVTLVCASVVLFALADLLPPPHASTKSDKPTHIKKRNIHTMLSGLFHIILFNTIGLFLINKR